MSKSSACRNKSQTSQAAARNDTSTAHSTLFLSPNDIFASAPIFQLDKWIAFVEQLVEATCSEKDQETFRALQQLLEIEHFNDNPRSSVYVELMFHGLQFACEEIRLRPTGKIVRFMILINRLFKYAVTPTHFPKDNSQHVDILSEIFPSLEAVYGLFRQLIHENAEVQAVEKEALQTCVGSSGEDGNEMANAASDGDPAFNVETAFTISEVAHIVNYFTGTFFAQLTAYQFVFAHKRKTIEEHMELVVEEPLIPFPLSEANLLSTFYVLSSPVTFVVILCVRIPNVVRSIQNRIFVKYVRGRPKEWKHRGSQFFLSYYFRVVLDSRQGGGSHE